MTLSLPPAALIFWNDEKQDAAVEMMGLAFSHPKSQQGWFVNSPLGEGVLEQMKVELGEDKFDAAWQRGAERDLHETSAALLALFAGEEGAELGLDEKETSPASRVPTASLPHPLTERELEVLRLLADGLTNPEIADRLYLSAGTIKVHTRNIYSKLGVSNRTQAVTQAQKLHLF
jgi:ATP/maltotriose-dependent transcriptional regulator MalT